MRANKCWIFLSLFLFVPFAQAQWVMVARAASATVQHMTQKQPTGEGYDFATVILEAPSNKVYETALASIKKHPDVTITKTDAKKQLIEFNNGKQYGSMQATTLGPKVTQLMVGATLVPGQISPVSNVVDGILKVCAEMNVQCTAD